MKSLLGIEFNDAQLNALNKYASRLGVDVSEMIESATREHLESIAPKQSNCSNIVLFRLSKDEKANA